MRLGVVDIGMRRRFEREGSTGTKLDEYSTDDAKWQGVVEKDRDANGKF
jgi:hypothetical protein